MWKQICNINLFIVRILNNYYFSVIKISRLFILEEVKKENNSSLSTNNPEIISFNPFAYMLLDFIYK